MREAAVVLRSMFAVSLPSFAQDTGESRSPEETVTSTSSAEETTAISVSTIPSVAVDVDTRSPGFLILATTIASPVAGIVFTAAAPSNNQVVTRGIAERVLGGVSERFNFLAKVLALSRKNLFSEMS